MWSTVYGRFSVSRVNAPRFDGPKGEDSYGAGCWVGFLPLRPTFRPGQRRASIFGLSAHRSFEREDDRTNRKKSSLYIPGLNEKLLAVRHVGILEIGKSLRHTQMCAREAVVPSEFVFVPHRPKEAQKKSSC